MFIVFHATTTPQRRAPFQEFLTRGVAEAIVVDRTAILRTPRRWADASSSTLSQRRFCLSDCLSLFTFYNKKYGPYLLVRLRVRSSGQNVTDPRTMHVCILAIALRSPALERAALR